MDTTERENPIAAEPPTIGEDSRTVSEPAAATKAPAPAEIRDHELIRRIGQGSYGEVWLARNVMGTYRAVKIVYRAAFEHARPFEREFNGIQKFEPLSRSHDGFVDILQIGRTEDYFYYVMELADDVVACQQIDPNRYEPMTLRSEVQGKKALPFEKCVELGLSLTQALSKLHEHGLIHRDIKPSNIIFVNGQPKLADIGLVAEQSEAKSFVGTEGFIPPEGPGTPQADIYSLGKVLYEIATGKDRHEFPALPTLLGETESDTHLLELNTVFLKACQTDLRQRYQTCEQMQGDLLLLRGGKSVKQAQQIERRMARLIKISVVGAIFTVFTLSGMAYLKLQERKAATQAQRETTLRLRAEAGELAARQHQYAAEMNLAQQALHVNDFGRAMELVNRQLPTASGPDLRGFEWRYLWSQTRGDEMATLRGHSNIVGTVAFSPDGRNLATAGYDSVVRIWDLDRRVPTKLTLALPGETITDLSYSTNGNVLASASFPGLLWPSASFSGVRLWDTRTGEKLRTIQEAHLWAAFSPDGKTFAAQVSGGVGLWHIDGWVSRRVLPDVRGPIAFSRDGDLLATFKPSGVVLWHTASGTVAATLDDPQPAERQFVAFSPDANTVAVSSATHDLKVWDWRRKEVLAALNEHSAMLFQVAFSPDGETFATCSADQTIRLWSASTYQRLALLKGHENEVWAIRFSPDGKTLASGGKDNLLKLWDLSPKPELPTRLENAVPLWFSRDGKTLATWNSDNHLAFREADTLQEVRKLRVAATERILSVKLSPDASTLAVMMPKRRVRIIDVASGNENAVVEGDPGRFYFDMAFSPNGRLLATRMTNGAVQVWDTRNGMPHTRFVPATWPMLFSPDAKALLSTDPTNNAIHVWDLATGKARSTLEGHTWVVRSLEISPDGRSLASASADNTVKLWNVEASRVSAILKGHKSAAVSAAFSPDGKTLASYGRDGKVRWWHLASEQEILTFDVSADPTSAVWLLFSGNGTTLALGEFSATASSARFWRAPSSITRKP